MRSRMVLVGFVEEKGEAVMKLWRESPGYMRV